MRRFSSASRATSAAFALVELAPPGAVGVDRRRELQLALRLLDLGFAALHVRLARLELREEGEGILRRLAVVAALEDEALRLGAQPLFPARSDASPSAIVCARVSSDCSRLVVFVASSRFCAASVASSLVSDVSRASTRARSRVTSASSSRAACSRCAADASRSRTALSRDESRASASCCRAS